MSHSVLERAMRPLADRLRTMVTRGVLRMRKGGSADELAQLQVSLGGRSTYDRVTHVLPFGLLSNPRPGSEAWVFWPGGARSKGYAVGVDDRRGRPEVEVGESGLYHPESGAMIVLKADGTIRVTGDLVVQGSVRASGAVSDGTGSIDEIRTSYNLHTHSTSTGPTGPPQPQLGGGGA